ncbi:MAG TPA: helix-turn-helix domain-containing protein, partial [Kofleriaceae bacterium]
RFIEHVDEVPAGDTRRLDRLPDGRTLLIFRAHDAGHGDLTLTGPRTRANFKASSGVAAVIVRFKPGWSTALFGVAASELTDRYVSLADAWGTQVDALCDELLAARGATEVVGRLSDAFARRARDVAEPMSASLARRAVRLLEHEEARVDRVAARLGVTARHLRRAFAESIGVGPKEYARSVRLRRAVNRAETSSDWARIATDAGYYDQAHLISDFRQLIGLTPVEYVNAIGADRNGGEACR